MENPNQNYILFPPFKKSRLRDIVQNNWLGCLLSQKKEGLGNCSIVRETEKG